MIRIKRFNEGYLEDKDQINDILNIAKDIGYRVSIRPELTNHNTIINIENTVSDDWRVDVRKNAPRLTDDETFIETYEEIYNRLSAFCDVKVEKQRDKSVLLIIPDSNEEISKSRTEHEEFMKRSRTNNW